MRKSAFLIATVLLVATGGTRARSQSQSTFPPPSSQIPSASSHFPGSVEDHPDPVHEASRERARETDRQKRIVDDTNRLVKLTAQYRSDVEHHGTLTADDQKLLLQIEKLAREVKDRMRGM